jgi:hypothetical protein
VEDRPARVARTEGVPEDMATGSTPPIDGDGVTTETVAEETAPPLADDPRVPQRDDADPSTSKELGGAAPGVGPGTKE